MQIIIRRDGKSIAINGDAVEALSQDGTIFSLFTSDKEGELHAQEWKDDQGRTWYRIGSFTAPLLGDTT
jgi:hypothetical protein